MEIGADMVVQTAQGLIDRNVDTRVQKSFIQGSEVLKPAPKLTRELCHIDWDDSTKQVYNLIRGLSPYPGAWTTLMGPDGKETVLKIFKTTKTELATAGRVGQLVIDKKHLCVACADRLLQIDELQLAGKKRMDAQAFLNGMKDLEKYSVA
jgi:methionyl-tRNA formyltransferase